VGVPEVVHAPARLDKLLVQMCVRMCMCLSVFATDSARTVVKAEVST